MKMKGEKLMKKRKAASVLAGIMIANIISGCASQGTEAEGGKDGEEPYVVSIIGVGDATEEACELVAEKVSEITREKYNVEVELKRFSYGTYTNEVNMMLASGEKMDLYFSFGKSVVTAANTGESLELTELLDEYGKGIKEIVPETGWSECTINNGIYAVPNQKEWGQGSAYVVRKDMVEGIDFDFESVTCEADLEPLMAAIKEAHPEVYPMASDNGFMFDVPYAYDGAGRDFGVCMFDNPTEIVDFTQTEEFEECVKRRYDWAQKGYILPDANNSTESAGVLIGTGKCAMAYTLYKPGVEAEWYRKTGVECLVYTMSDPMTVQGSYSTNVWYIAHQSERPDKAMQILNEIYTNPEVADLLINGVEDVHYIRNEEEGVLSYPEGMDAANTPYSSVAYSWPNELISTPWEQDGASIWEETAAFNESLELSPAAGFVWDNANVLNEITACNNVTAKYKNALLCGNLDPEEALPQMIKELKDAGVDTIVAEKQKQFDEWREKNK